MKLVKILNSQVAKSTISHTTETTLEFLSAPPSKLFFSIFFGGWCCTYNDYSHSVILSICNLIYYRNPPLRRLLRISISTTSKLFYTESFMREFHLGNSLQSAVENFYSEKRNSL